MRIPGIRLKEILALTSWTTSVPALAHSSL
jgi:hypothetical protein